MSYILEALKKSEQERALGQVPDLASAHTASHVQRPAWFWPLVAVLVLNSAVLIYLFGGKDEGPAGPAPAQVSRSETPETGPVATIRSVPVNPRPAQATPAPAQASRVLPGVEKPVRPVLPGSASSSIEKTPASDRQLPVKPAKKVGIKSQQAAVAPVADSRLPLWRELPLGARHGLDDLSLDVHVYSEQAQQRFILVNLRKYREGETLDEGPVVEQITSDGAVLYYQGQRFRLSSN